MKIEWNKVTWYSKTIALMLFIALPFLGFYFGSEYGEAKRSLQQEAGLLPVAHQLTQDPQAIEPQALQDTTGWKVLHGTGFTIKVPSSWYTETVKEDIEFQGVLAASFAPNAATSFVSGTKGDSSPIGIEIDPYRGRLPLSESIQNYWQGLPKTPIVFKGAWGYKIDDTPHFIHYEVLHGGVIYGIGWGAWGLRKPSPSEMEALDTILSTFEFFDERQTEEKGTIAWLVKSWKSIAPQIIPGYPPSNVAFYGYPHKIQFIGNNHMIIEYETDFNDHLALIDYRGKFTYIDGQTIASDQSPKWAEWIKKYGDPAATLNFYQFSSTREGDTVSPSDWVKISAGVDDFWPKP